MPRRISGMDLVEKAKKLDLKVAVLHEQCREYCDSVSDDKSVLEMLLKDLEDGHAGHVLITEVSWRLREAR